MNRLTRVVGHDGIAVVHTYDGNGNRETATYANGVVLTYNGEELHYDADGNTTYSEVRQYYKNDTYDMFLLHIDSSCMVIIYASF